MHVQCAPVVPGPTTRVVYSPLDIRSVSITGGPLADWQRVNRQISFRLGMKKLRTEGSIENLRIAAGLSSAEYRLPRFMDGAVYKMLEAAAWEIAREPDPELEQFVAEMTELISQVQDADGYINSYYQAVAPGPRYGQIDRSHEIYLAGLLALAGIAADRAGLGDRLLGLGRRFADHVAERFTGTVTGGADGHPGAEFAMIELYRHTQDSRYLDLAESMIDKRGHGALGAQHGGSRYLQDHLPIREAETVVGHAVRAMYLDAGVVDLYVETGEAALLTSSVRRWEDMVATKMSLTGGIGSRHSGEAFGDSCELPPDRAYNESCAAFAAIFWNWRLLLATGESRYADIIERLLFNAFAASTSRDGSRYFYVNPLQRRPDHFEADDPGRRHEWYACPCCPPNIMRLVSSLGHYVATRTIEGLAIHQYLPAKIDFDLGSGPISLELQTKYPWQGWIEVLVRAAPPAPWTLALRIPSWVGDGGATVSINGADAIPATADDGYLRCRRSWTAGDLITLDLAMPVRLVAADPRIDALRGCVAVERGPLVYCLEHIDHPGSALEEVALDATSQPRVSEVEFPETGRSVIIGFPGSVRTSTGDHSGLPYWPLGRTAPTTDRPIELVAVPYYQWDNRGPGSMRVWIPADLDHRGDNRLGGTIYTDEDYARAEAFTPWRMESRLPGVVGPVEWLPDSSRFCFRLGTAGGWRFQIGEQSSTSSQDAFDHDHLAAALTTATERNVPSERLELGNLNWRWPSGIEFDFADDRWCWDGQECRRLTEDERYGVRSPDGDRLAFTRDHDLWVRDLATGRERRLTDGGRTDSFYGEVVPSPLRRAGLPDAGQAGRETAVLWSPDGRRLLTHRIDTAGAGKITMSLSTPLSGAVRPEAVEYLYPLPGDEVLPTALLLIIDLDSGRITPMDIPPLEMYYYGSPIPAAGTTSRSMWWREDGESIYVVHRSRGHRRVVLYEVGVDGTSRVVVDESAETPIDTNLSTSGPVNHRTIDDQDLTLWYSQQDGWAHLYLYRTSTGNLIRRLTSGEWAVADVCHADTAFVYFTAVGRNPDEDPYLRRLYRIRLDEPGAQPELLTSQAGSHQISFAPDGSSFLTTWSMIHSTPVTQLCRPTGDVIGTIATVDLSGLLASGWAYPERFVAPARDGHTKVYGVIIRPSSFDPAISYPVIDSIYGGPQMNQAPVAMIEATTADHRLWEAQAIAELGFVVVMIDGLGMPYRSRGFRDVSYRNLADAGLPDHISALRSLVKRYPYLDLDRVGIFGHSAGGYASAQAILAHPDFYKVCVSSAGNHDHRIDKASWIERYQGWPVGDYYVEQANRTTADRLEGKLLLVHGEADENVPVAATLSLVDALVTADKDFDLLILPNRPHACGADPYVIRRRWDYFVRHLAGQQPPRYRLRRTPEADAVR